jgi:2-polyprenyl-3-methyl-5-hydroxy-6-metoxy-1,4-benzoquinol methylase
LSTKEPQYSKIFEYRKNPFSMGVNATHLWMDDPKHLSFTFSRYKFVSKMLKGHESVLEIGCGDGFAARIVASEVKSLVLTDFDLLFVEEAKLYSLPPYEYVVEVHDFVNDGKFPNREFSAAYSLDVLEHISIDDEHRFLSNVVDSLRPEGILILGTPSIFSQPYASESSKLGHINCKSGEELSSLLLKYFHNVQIFCMNDEVLHTGFEKMAHYYFAICTTKKN